MPLLAPAHHLTQQVDRLVDLGYPAIAGTDETTFRELLAPLCRLADSAEGANGESALLVLLVVTAALVPTVAAVEAVTVRGRTGWTDMGDELPAFRPIKEVQVPDAPAYLLTGMDTGADTLGVRPRDALPWILDRGRTPLTIDEGVAVMTQHPKVFAERNAYQALASRAPNKRIPSFWISKGAPRLGWCWEGNPHSWLGAASADALRLAH